MKEELLKENLQGLSGGLPQPREGQVMQRMQSKYTTAITVQQPRNLDDVVAAVMREAEYAGEAFFYSWGSGKNHVQGASVGLAMTVAREWGNCAVETEVEETKDAYIFTSHFVDVEKGFTISRPFRQSKKWQVFGKMDDMRKDDTRFQIGASKAIRNAVKSAVPNWIMEQAVAKAQDTVEKNITKDGIAKSSDRAVSALAGMGVTEEQIIEKIGKPKTQWVTQDIIDLRTAYSAIKTGEAYAEEIFPALVDSSLEKAPAADAKAKAAEEKKVKAAAAKAERERKASEKQAEKKAKEQSKAEADKKKAEQDAKEEPAADFNAEPPTEEVVAPKEEQAADDRPPILLLFEKEGIDPITALEAMQAFKKPMLKGNQTLEDVTAEQQAMIEGNVAGFKAAITKYLDSDK